MIGKSRFNHKIFAALVVACLAAPVVCSADAATNGGAEQSPEELAAAPAAMGAAVGQFFESETPNLEDLHGPMDFLSRHAGEDVVSEANRPVFEAVQVGLWNMQKEEVAPDQDSLTADQIRARAVKYAAMSRLLGRFLNKRQSLGVGGLAQKYRSLGDGRLTLVDAQIEAARKQWEKTLFSTDAVDIKKPTLKVPNSFLKLPKYNPAAAELHNQAEAFRDEIEKQFKIGETTVIRPFPDGKFHVTHIGFHAFESTHETRAAVAVADIESKERREIVDKGVFSMRSYVFEIGIIPGNAVDVNASYYVRVSRDGRTIFGKLKDGRAQWYDYAINKNRPGHLNGTYYFEGVKIYPGDVSWERVPRLRLAQGPDMNRPLTVVGLLGAWVGSLAMGAAMDGRHFGLAMLLGSSIFLCLFGLYRRLEEIDLYTVAKARWGAWVDRIS